MKNQFPEIGYTQANLRHLLGLLGLTQREAAEKLGCSLRNVQNWLMGDDKGGHRDMPLLYWKTLFSLLPVEQRNQGGYCVYWREQDNSLTKIDEVYSTLPLAMKVAQTWGSSEYSDMVIEYGEQLICESIRLPSGEIVFRPIHETMIKGK